MRRLSLLGCSALLAAVVLAAGATGDLDILAPGPFDGYVIGDERALTAHVDQQAIERGAIPLESLFAAGRRLFDTAFTAADGQGRPDQNGVFPPLARNRREGVESFNRISAPDADSCSGCHNKPRIGGGGDNVANVFVLGQRFSFFDDPSRPDENGLPAPGSVQDAANQRNTLGMFGAGAIEMLAREMSAELIGQRMGALQRAAALGRDVQQPLTAKGVPFGFLTARPDGTVNTAGVEGVNADLIIRPFHQKGVVVSLREFTNNAFPHHHGMQPVERFGAGTDSDGDGVTDELSVGDVTATTLFQAALGVPGQVIPRNRRVEAAILRGETLFKRIGCASCHVPELRLNDRHFSEPNPFNPPNNLRPGDVRRPFRFDLTREGEGPRLERSPQGGAIVRAFTDLKRHYMGEHPLMHNERVVQGGVPTSVFITKKLWGFASEPHFLHHGCATTISQAILAHGGEAQIPRDRFDGLPASDRAAVIEFLKSLRVLPPNTSALIVDERGRPRNDLPGR